MPPAKAKCEGKERDWHRETGTEAAPPGARPGTPLGSPRLSGTGQRLHPGHSAVCLPRVWPEASWEEVTSSGKPRPLGWPYRTLQQLPFSLNLGLLTLRLNRKLQPGQGRQSLIAAAPGVGKSYPGCDGPGWPVLLSEVTQELLAGERRIN